MGNIYISKGWVGFLFIGIDNFFSPAASLSVWLTAEQLQEQIDGHWRPGGHSEINYISLDTRSYLYHLDSSEMKGLWLKFVITTGLFREGGERSGSAQRKIPVVEMMQSGTWNQLRYLFLLLLITGGKMNQEVGNLAKETWPKRLEYQIKQEALPSYGRFIDWFFKTLFK